MQTIIAHTRDQVLRSSKHRAVIPSDVEEVAIRCLANGPHERYQDSDSLERSFSQCWDSEKWTQSDVSEW